MNCLLPRIGLTVACEGIFIISRGNPRAPRRPKLSTSTYSSVRPIAGRIRADLPRRLPVSVIANLPYSA